MDCTPSPFPFPSLSLPFCCAVLTVVQSVGSPRRCRLGWPADRLRSAAVACTHVAMACRWLRTACARPPFTRLRHLRVGVRCSPVFIARLRSAVARLCSATVHTRSTMACSRWRSCFVARARRRIAGAPLLLPYGGRWLSRAAALAYCCRVHVAFWGSVSRASWRWLEAGRVDGRHATRRLSRCLGESVVAELWLMHAANRTCKTLCVCVVSATRMNRPLLLLEQ